MANILSSTDFVEVEKLYYIPTLKNYPERVVILNGVIDVSQLQFLKQYALTVAEVTASTELKEALKYFTFAKWIRTQWLEATQVGASVRKEQIKGVPTYDSTREVDSLNMCIDIVNETLGTTYQNLKPFINY